MQRKVTKAARNERRKLKATTLNTVGLAMFGLGALTPVFTQPSEARDLLTIALSSVSLYVLHELARLVLGGLED